MLPTEADPGEMMSGSVRNPPISSESRYAQAPPHTAADPHKNPASASNSGATTVASGSQSSGSRARTDRASSLAASSLARPNTSPTRPSGTRHGPAA
jgi:hypothetical protein